MPLSAQARTMVPGLTCALFMQLITTYCGAAAAGPARVTAAADVAAALWLASADAPPTVVSSITPPSAAIVARIFINMACLLWHLGATGRAPGHDCSGSSPFACYDLGRMPKVVPCVRNTKSKDLCHMLAGL